MTRSNDKNNLRIDKYLWSVRIYKTRSLASDACKKGRVFLNGQQVKPSYIVNINDIFMVKKPPASFIFKVAGLPSSRISAKLVGNYIHDLTPESEKEKLATRLLPDSGFRVRGTGRPTKRERRNIDKLKGDML